MNDHVHPRELRLREHFAPLAADIQSRNLLAGLVQDRLPADADDAELEAAVAAARQAWSPLFKPTRPTTPTPHLPLGFRAPQSKDHRQAAAIERMLSAGNPWSHGTWSITAQVVITSADPGLAAKLKREAGA